MEPYSLWVFAHVMLLVYWLGADLGVLLLALGAKNPNYTFEQRAVMLEYSMKIDFTPRLASALMFPVGLHMSASLGLVAVSQTAFILVWLAAIVWMGVIIGQVALEGRPISNLLRRLNLGWQGILFFVLMGVGILSWTNDVPFETQWLALKIILFAMIFAMSILIDVLFAPVGPGFMKLAEYGSTPDIEREISHGINGAIVPVLIIYLLLAVIAFIGIAKPI